MARLSLDVPEDVLEGLVVKELKWQYEGCDPDRGWNAEDKLYNKKMRKHLKKVIRHFSTHADYCKWRDERG